MIDVSRLSLNPDDALIVVDVQRDFLLGGSLPTSCQRGFLPNINRYIDLFSAHGSPIIASRDWHPSNHCSFQAQGGKWPKHCVQGSPGAEFPSALRLPASTTVISKGTHSDREEYSAFSNPKLQQLLREHHIRRLFVCGVATEYCVLETVKDARAADYEVVLLIDGIGPADPQSGREAMRTMQDLGASQYESERKNSGVTPASVLLTDLYQLTMLQAYFDQGMEETAVFEFFVRKLPHDRSFLMAAGLEQVLDYLEALRFAADELDWLDSTGRFRREFVDYLEQLRFTGDVHAIPEGSLFFPHEPILRVTAPMPQAQLVESRLINLLQFQTLIASKAVRSVLAAPDKLLVDFGMRRAHGAEAGLLAARAAYLAGFSGTATVLAGQQFDIPIYGTMAHSFVQAHDDEIEAFEHFALSNPDNVVLLIDTYDNEMAAEKSIALAARLKQRGIKVKGVRLDSGDLADHARRVRGILDRGDLADVTIFASGNLDEFKLQELLASGAPIDGFGIGSRLDVSSDAPYLDCAYKLQEYAGRPRRKKSEGKATWPGRKQVYRRYDKDGHLLRDIVTLETDPHEGEPLLQLVMQNGQRLATTTAASLDDARVRAATGLRQLPPPLRSLDQKSDYPVDISSSLHELAAALDAAIATSLKM